MKVKYDMKTSLLWREKPNKKAYIWSRVLNMLPFALLWLIFDLTFIVSMFLVPGWILSAAITILIMFFLLHLTPVWIWIGGIIKGVKEHKNIEYAFTEKRIIIRSGFIGIDFKNIYCSDVESVNLKVGFVNRVLKVGDIYIKSNDKSTVIYDIKNPYEITNKLQKVTLDIKTDIYYPNALRPGENSGYNTKYKGEYEWEVMILVR